MQPDPNRQWFVYFNEKEMGPFFEREVLQKLKISEFDPSAYVFTEGMTDWALVQDTPVLLRGPEPAAAKGQSQIRAVPPPEPEETISEESLPVEDPFADVASQGFTDESAVPSSNLREQTASRSQSQTHQPEGNDPTRLADFSSPEHSRPGAGGTASGTAAGTQSGFKSVTNGGQSAPPKAAAAAPAAKPEKKGFSLFSKKKKDDSKVTEAPAAKEKTNSGVVGRGKTNPGVGQTAQPAPEAAAAAPGKATIVKEKKKTSPIVLGGLVFVIILGALYGANNMGIQIPYVSMFLNGGETTPKAPPVSAEPPPEMADGMDNPATPPATDAANPDAAANPNAAAAGANTQNPPANPAAPGAAGQPQAPKKQAAVSTGVEGLQAFRGSKDPAGKPFKLAPPVGDKFPLIVGALSPLLDVQQIAIAVFPDNERNLMMIPQIWLLKAPVINGYFSLGPLNLDGSPLPPGRYLVYAQLGDKSLGGEQIDIGNWPAPAEVERIRGNFQKEREKVAGSEREAFDMKLREVANAFSQLKTKSSAANKGLKGRREWDSFKRPWIASLSKAIKDQDAVSSGPMFYGDAQTLLSKYLAELKKLYESYEMLSTGGSKFLVRQRGPDALGKQMAEILRIQNEINTTSKGLAEKPLQAFQLDPKKVQDNLAAFAVSDRIKK